MGDQESRPPAGTPPSNASGHATVSIGDIGRQTAYWLQNIDNPRQWPNKDQTKSYLLLIQELLATAPVASTILANTKMLKQLTSDVDSIKKTVTNIKYSTPPPMSYRNALFSGLPITPTPKPVTPGHAANEIVIKLGDQTTIAMMKSTNEDKIVDIVNNALKAQQINDVKIRGVIKLGSGDLAIQTITKEDLNKIKDNDSWVKNLGPSARSVTKTYPVLVFTSKMNLYRRSTPELFQTHLRHWNPYIAPSHVAQLHPGKENEVGGLILVFKTVEEANNCITDGVVIDGKMHRAVLYNRECRIKQCFKCYKYGHISSECPNQECCGRCAKAHPTSTKTNQHDQCKAEDPEQCAACGGKHNAWSKQCSLRKREMTRVEMAKRNTPIRYSSGSIKSASSIDVTPAFTPPSSSTTNTDTIVDADMEDNEGFQTVQSKGARKRPYLAETSKTSSYLADADKRPYLPRPDRVNRGIRGRSMSPTKSTRCQKDRTTHDPSTPHTQDQQRQPLAPRDSNAVSTRKARQEAGEQLEWNSAVKGLTSIDIVPSQARQ